MFHLTGDYEDNGKFLHSLMLHPESAAARGRAPAPAGACTCEAAAPAEAG